MNLRRILAGLAGAMLAPLALAARPEITLNLKDAEISSLIATVSEVTGKNFIVDGRVKGKVTVISASPMSPDGVYETFLAVLQVNGFAAIPAGEAIKIVPETNARTDGGVRSSSGRGLPMDEVVTHVYQIQNISAAQLVPILRPMVAQWGHLAAYQASNMLIISDRASNVARLELLIRQMDQAGDREIEYVRLQNASASEVVRILTTLTQQDKQADPSVRPTAIIADERSNSVLIGGDKSERTKFIEIIKQLDIPLKDDGATQVVYLSYASAENLAPILEGYAQQVTEAGARGGAAGGAAAPAVNTGGGGGPDRARVIADKDTNALIITAAPKAMRQIRDVIAQLDIERAQVLVEAIIAEVSLDKQSELGINWAAFNAERILSASILDPTTVFSVIGATAGNSTTSAAAAAGAFPGTIIGGGRDGGDDGTSFAVLIKMLKGDADTNVLSTPTLVTLDNEEAKFSAGQEVPFLTGQFSTTGTGATTTGAINPFQTIERKDVGLTLGVTPQINEGNSVKLKLSLEASQLAGSAATLNAVTQKRTLTNTVSVENGQILVIGGLIDDTLTDTQNGVPFLSDIPLLGMFFKSRSVSKLKRNLMIFIRPSILRRPADGDYYTRRKYETMRQEQIRAMSGAVPLIGGRRPVLEDLDAYRANAQNAPPPPPQPEPVQVPAPIVAAPPPAPLAGVPPSPIAPPDPAPPARPPGSAAEPGEATVPAVPGPSTNEPEPPPPPAQ